MLSLLAWFIPHAEWKVNKSIIPSYTLICLPERRDYLEFPRRIIVFRPRPKRIFPRITNLSIRWHLCNKRIKPITQSLFKKVLPENCKTYCASNVWRGHILTATCQENSSHSDNRQMEKNVYSNISVQVLGQMTDGDLPNPKAVQTLIYTLYRVRTVVGWYIKTEYCARGTVEIPRSAGSTAPTENIFYRFSI